MDECIKAKIESQGTKAIPLKDTSINFDKRNPIGISYDCSVEIGVKTMDQMLYFIRNVMI